MKPEKREIPGGRDSRICIVGAGPAGLAAAATLGDRGYRHVVLLEKGDRVGGKCWTRLGDGTPLDAGAVFVLSHYPTVMRFARRAGVHLERAIPMQHLGLDGTVRPFGRPPRPYPLGRRILEFMRIGLEMGRAMPLYLRPFGELAPGLLKRFALPYAEWIRQRGFEYLNLTAYPLLESWGYGHAEHQVPALYTFASMPNYAPRRNALLMWDLSRIPMYQIREGYGEMWRRIAEPMDVRLNCEIRAIERGKSGGVVRTGNGTVEFDRLVFACPPKGLLDLIDASEEERAVFGRLRFLECWQMSVRVEGLMDTCIVDRNLRFDRMGRTTGFFRYRPGSDWYYFFGYTGGLSDDEIRSLFEAEVRELGGRFKGPLDFYVRWPYFPHYGSRDVASGIHARQERLQGERGTYYTGEFTVPMGVEYAALHGERLVSRFFA